MGKKATSQKTPAHHRKRRTREHVIADLSVHHVEGIILRAGFTAQRTVVDYGFDLWMETFDEEGGIESDYIRLQVKASDKLREYELAQKGVFSFQISASDYDYWKGSLLPVLFILYDAKLGEAYWMEIHDFAQSQSEPIKGQSVQMHAPRHQIFGVQTLYLMRERKLEILHQSRKTKHAES
jgi:hypothetical protein